MTRGSLLLLLLGTMLAGHAQASGCPPVDYAFFGFDRVGQMARAADGRVFVADHNSRVQVFDANGNYLAQFGSSGTGLGQFLGATGVAFDAAGNIFVADQFGNRITVLSPALVPLFAFGSLGTGPGQLTGPTNLALSPNGQVLYVTELYGDRVSMFHLDGSFIASFGSTGAALGQLDHPFGIVADPTGTVYIADQVNNRIQRFTAAGTPIDAWGSFGSGPGWFHYVVGLGLDGNGNLYATDQLNNRVQIFRLDGTFVCEFGSFGSALGLFYNPWAVLPIPTSAKIWVGDTFNYRIVVYDEKSVPASPTTWGSLKSQYR